MEVTWVFKGVSMITEEVYQGAVEVIELCQDYRTSRHFDKTARYLNNIRKLGHMNTQRQTQTDTPEGSGERSTPQNKCIPVLYTLQMQHKKRETRDRERYNCLITKQ